MTVDLSTGFEECWEVRDDWKRHLGNYDEIIPPNARLIGFAGAAGAGKSSAAAYLQEAHGFTVRSFAAAMKESVAALLGVTVDDLERWKNDPLVWVTVSVDIEGLFVPGIKLTTREFLQRYGTESHRDVFGPDFWVELGMRGVYRASGLRVAWSDVRFPNEAEAIRQAGGIIVRIERPGYGGTDAHSAERGLPADVVIENEAGIPELHTTLDQLVNSEER